MPDSPPPSLDAVRDGLLAVQRRLRASETAAKGARTKAGRREPAVLERLVDRELEVMAPAFGGSLSEAPWAPLLRRLSAEFSPPPGSPLTAEVAARLVEGAARGFSRDQVAALCALRPRDLRRGLRSSPLLDELLELADLVAEATYLARIERRSVEDPKAAMWVMERRWPERWAPRKHGDGRGAFSAANPMVGGALPRPAGSVRTLGLLPPLPPDPRAEGDTQTDTESTEEADPAIKPAASSGLPLEDISRKVR